MPDLAKRIAINSTYEPAMSGVNAMGGAVGVARDLVGIKTFPDIADYRITDWGKRGKNALKTTFGAPAQLGVAWQEGDQKKLF